MIDRIVEIKQVLEDMVCEQLNGDACHVNTCELGEVIDMIKDCAEAIYYCTAAESKQKM